MRDLKKIAKAMALAMAIVMTVPAGVPMSTATVAEAATVKLSATKKTLTKGKTYTLKMLGTKKKVTWKSSKTSVATVNSKGKVTAKKAGTATITAKVGTKTYKCKITVKNPVNKYVAKAPFEAKELKIDKYTMAVPKNWAMNKLEANGETVYMLMPEETDILNGVSYVTLTVKKSEGATQENFELLKTFLGETLTKENITAILSETALGDTATPTDFSFGEEAINLGKATVVSYAAEAVDATGAKATLKQTVYDVFANNYLVEVAITDIGEDKPVTDTGAGETGTAETVPETGEAEKTADVYEVGKYIVNSLIYVK